MKNILLVCYGGGHAQIILPVVEKLKLSYNVSVLPLTTAKALFNGVGYTVLSYDDLSYLEKDDFSTYGIKIIGDTPQNSIVTRKETIAYNGINYLNLVRELGVELAAKKFAEEGRQCFLPIDFMRKIFQKIKPDLVVATNSPRSERAALEVAKQQKIQSVCIVDLFATFEKEWIAKANYASKVCVLNAEVKDMLIREGRDFDDVEITGNPAFDKLSDDGLRKTATSYKACHLPENKKILFWASQQPEQEVHPITGESGGDPKLAHKVENELIDFVNRNDDWILVIRPHPSETRDPVENGSNVFWSSPCQPMTDILFTCDCLVTIASTIALEAYLVGKPVITVDLSIYTQDVPFSKMGISKGVTSIDQLESSIIEACESLSQNSLSSSLNSTNKVVNVINELIS